jgi:hypothetical protein
MRLQELFELLTGLIQQSLTPVHRTDTDLDNSDINIKAKTLLDQIFI